MRINYLFIRIVKLLVVELYCTHTAACIFYYLATTMPPSREGYTWIGSLKMGDYSYSHFRDIDLWKRYITSLYFAIVTMATVGYGEIHAVNVREMIFIMIYVSFDMILGAYLLGNMTALIVKGSKTEKFRDKMTDLMKYMNENKLGKRISSEIKGHVQLQYERDCTEAAVLQDIPAAIRSKISQKLYEPLLRQVFLFNGCSLGFIKQVATRVHEEFFLPGEEVIKQGLIVDQLYFVWGGLLEAVGRDEDGNKQESLQHLQTRSTFGEISVLGDIPEPYTIRVRELCRLLRLDKHSCIELLETHFHDGRIILDNLLEGKVSTLQNKLMESDITLLIEKRESELTMRLICAAYDGDLHRLKRLVEKGADPNKTDYNGRSPLHVAASKGYEDITLFLIEQGVDINISDNFGNTALLEAIKNKHDQVVSILVKTGATLILENPGSCLCMAVAKNDLGFMKRVLENSINPNSKNYDLRTPLHIAASEGLFSMVNLLLEAGASVFPKDRWGNTPLDDARLGGNKNLIKLLEDAKCSQIQGMQRKKCIIFPFDPWHTNEDRRQGIVLWVPQTTEELIKTAMQQFKFSGVYCILSENGGKIIDVDMISDGAKLFLVEEC